MLESGRQLLVSLQGWNLSRNWCLGFLQLLGNRQVWDSGLHFAFCTAIGTSISLLLRIWRTWPCRFLGSLRVGSKTPFSILWVFHFPFLLFASLRTPSLSWNNPRISGWFLRLWQSLMCRLCSELQRVYKFPHAGWLTLGRAADRYRSLLLGHHLWARPS